MTTKEKIEVLEEAIKIIKTTGWNANGICLSVFISLPYIDQFKVHGLNSDTVDLFLLECGITLPKRMSNDFCWPLTKAGDEQRRAFLREAIERLKKEL